MGHRHRRLVSAWIGAGASSPSRDPQGGGHSAVRRAAGLPKPAGAVSGRKTPVGSSPSRSVAVHAAGRAPVAAGASSFSVTPIVMGGSSSPAGFGPIGIAVTPDGAYGFVAQENTDAIYVFNPESNTLQTQIGVSDNTDPVGVAVNPLIRYAYVTLSGATQVAIIDANPQSPTFPQIVTIFPSGYENDSPTGVAESPGGQYRWVANETGGSCNCGTIQVTQIATADTIGGIGGTGGTGGVGGRILGTAGQDGSPGGVG